MNIRYVGFLIAAFAVFVFLFSQDFFAHVAWQKYGKPDVALWLVRNDAAFAILLGNYYFGATIGRSEYNPEKAKQAFEKAVKANPKVLWGHYELARIYFLENKFDRALEEINKELEANPENLRALYIRGLIYGYRNQQGDLERAEENFRRFTIWAPKEWGGYNDHAWVLSRLGRYVDAKDVIGLAFKNALDVQGNPWLWNGLGLAELNLEEYKSAQNSFEKALKFAEKLTLSDWIKAYPGNNPNNAESGLLAFRAAITENVQRSSRGDK